MYSKKKINDVYIYIDHGDDVHDHEQLIENVKQLDWFRRRIKSYYEKKHVQLREPEESI